MIDTGEDKNVNDISDFMRDAGYDKIDTLILTHPDKDHIGGASEIISSFNVSTVIEGAYAPLTEDYTLYHMTMEDMNINPIILNGNYSFEFDGCEFLIDAPKKQKYTEKQSNNSSLVVSLTCGERRFLFCGDAMELRLAELTESEIGAHDFVKLPYHGNYLENYREFLDEVKPKYGAITCSGKNPTDDRTIDLLIEYMVHAYQTKNGNINVLCDENKITITQK
jgi:beta-lactamase superfamily II metal-dependent hydrolase